MRGVGTEILGDGQQQIMEACITKGGQGGGGGCLWYSPPGIVAREDALSYFLPGLELGRDQGCEQSHGLNV